MKVVGIISSPHAEGNGATLVREALQGAKEAGALVLEVFLPKYRIEYCRDCRACMSTGRCAVQDDFQELRQLLCEADGIILSTPTYGADVIGIATAGSFGAAKAAQCSIPEAVDQASHHQGQGGDERSLRGARPQRHCGGGLKGML
jgi:hypothetical protein